jgi:hypothetical protein
MCRESHLFPFIARTIRANIAYACVVMTWAERMRSGNIKQNSTDSTLLFHEFLPEVATKGFVGSSFEGLLRSLAHG